MAKRKLCKSIFIGSVIGGLVAMADPKVRHYTKEKLSDLSKSSFQMVKNPSQTIHKVRTTFNQVNNRVLDGADRAIKTLEMIEQSLQELSKK